MNAKFDSTPRAAQRVLKEHLRKIFEERVPFNRVLGLKLVSLDTKNPRIRFDMRPDLIGNPTRGALHGGVISSVLDVTAGMVIHLAFIERHGLQEDLVFPNIGTVDLRVDYLRPGRGKHFVATGRVLRMGRRIAVAHVELANDEGELIATGAAAYVVG
ncbi:MAG TPA: thioesterase family protein [Burkholderiales bacterium]|nr:thioesterase family protein [Burkholderiales bacterium]